MLRCGHIAYLNALPLFAGFDSLPCCAKITSGTPTDLNRMLNENRIDVGLISSIEYIRHSDSYRLVSPWGIACHGPVKSVLLFLKKPFKSIRTIAVTGESASSVALLALLCQRHSLKSQLFFSSSPAQEKAADAYLLIGDSALVHAQNSSNDRLDLALLWQRWTGLPFVFAVLAQRADLSDENLKNLQTYRAQIKINQEWFAKNSHSILANASLKNGLSIALMQNYLQKIVYRLGENELKGLARFQTELNNNLPCLVKQKNDPSYLLGFNELELCTTSKSL